MKRITREKGKVASVACPWSINKFPDHSAECVNALAKKITAITTRNGFRFCTESSGEKFPCAAPFTFRAGVRRDLRNF